MRLQVGLVDVHRVWAPRRRRGRRVWPFNGLGEDRLVNNPRFARLPRGLQTPRPLVHRLDRLAAPAVRERHALDGPDLLDALALQVVHQVGGAGPHPTQPHSGPPPRLQKGIVTHEAGEPPSEQLPEFQPLFCHLLPEEAAIGRPAILAHEALRQHARRVLNEPGEHRVAAGQAPLDAALQRQQVDPQEPLADLHARLDYPIALVLVGGGGLLQRGPRPEFGHPATQRLDRRLVVALQRD